MRKISLLLLSFVLVCASITAYAENLTQVINQTLGAYANANIGVTVYDLHAHKIVYSRQAEHLYNPASTMKLLTATAALLYLRPDFNFKTQIYAYPYHLQHGVLQGNLYLKFTGDPSLTTNDIVNMIHALRQQGIRSIHGHIYLDTFSFDQKFYEPGSMWDDHNACFSAPVSAIIVNENCAKISLYRHFHHHHVTVRVVNPEPFIAVSNYVQPRSFDDHLCPLELSANEANQYRLSGCWYATQAQKQLDIAIKNPTRYLQHVLAHAFQQAHIDVRAQFALASVPATAHLLLSKHSVNLKQLIIKMLKESDNLYADSIFKTLGAYYFRRQGTWQAGSLAVKTILRKYTKLDVSTMKIVDGDGGSRYDLISPQQLSLLLQYIYAHKQLWQIIIPALPKPHEKHSTLCDRMQQRMFRHHLWAKTGSMASVSNLAGFLRTREGEYYAFVIMVNGFVDKLTPYRRLQDEIAGLLIAS